MGNANLNKAKREKNDEFYTRYEDIAAEIGHYVEYLRGKVVYCPCDDYRWSNFVKYFRDNFKVFGLKGLLASNYDIGDGAYVYRYDGNVEVTVKFSGKGGYREHDGMRDAADVIVTNPPFSLFRDFMAWIREGGKIKSDFLVIGALNVVTCKSIFPLIMDGEMNLGFTKRGTGKTRFTDSEGKEFVMSSCCWWTSFPGYIPPPMEFSEKYDSDRYLKYDNYDAINVDRSRDVPGDYDGVMGVPVSFIDVMNPGQFEIVGVTKPWDLGGDAKICGKKKYCRILVRRVHQEPDGQK